MPGRLLGDDSEDVVDEDPAGERVARVTGLIEGLLSWLCRVLWGTAAMPDDTATGPACRGADCTTCSRRHVCTRAAAREFSDLHKLRQDCLHFVELDRMEQSDYTNHRCHHQFAVVIDPTEKLHYIRVDASLVPQQTSQPARVQTVRRAHGGIAVPGLQM
jgi:hypothetical protein